MSQYLNQWVECGGVFYPEYIHERDDFPEDDDSELPSPTLKDFTNIQEF